MNQNKIHLFRVTLKDIQCIKKMTRFPHENTIHEKMLNKNKLIYIPTLFSFFLKLTHINEYEFAVNKI